MNFVEPVTLSGELVRLRPLHVEDHDALIAAASDGELWNLGFTNVAAPDEMATKIEQLLAAQRAGTMLPFVVRRTDGSTDGSTNGSTNGSVIGMTSYCNIDATNRRVEIGHTWNAASAQRTGTNTESKLLLLRHAFDELDCIAVEFRTHWLNHPSRRAIERLGAKQDGVLRSHSISRDGTLRDTVVYSIIAAEWPAIENELKRKLGA